MHILLRASIFQSAVGDTSWHVAAAVSMLQATRPRAIVDLIRSAEDFRIDLSSEGTLPQPKKCTRCGYICSQSVCKACQLLEGLNKGLPSMGISRARQVKNKSSSKAAAGKLHQTSAGSSPADSRACGESACMCGSNSSKDAQSSQHASAGEMCDTEQGAHCRQKDRASNQAARHASVPQADAAVLTDARDAPGLQSEAAGLSAAHNAACDCAVQAPAATCASNEDWTLPSNFTDAADAQHNAQSGIARATDSSTSHNRQDSVQRSSSLQAPIRVHGKLYQSNLRAVDAHPSARRPVPADFGTAW